MKGFLKKAYEEKLEEIKNLRSKRFPPRERPFVSFSEALQRGRAPRIIAEIKRASPSRGVLREDLDILKQAQLYELGGAIAISVLTDKNFEGSIEDLKLLSQKVRLPILRKDFLIDPIQLEEAFSYGADAVLLIGGLLSKNRLKELLKEAKSLGLEALVEVHKEEELEMVLETEAFIIGINSRDLETLNVNLELIERLFPKIPKDRLVIAESGIKGRKDLKRLMDMGIENFLIGEALVLAQDPLKMLKELKGHGPDQNMWHNPQGGCPFLR
jgi:indole-3-glycerol phosphate synthase